MKREDIDFFHQATLRICGSLDMETMLADCYEYIRKYIPANGMCLSIINRVSETIEFVAQTLDDGIQVINHPVKLSPEAIAFISEYEQTNEHLYKIANDPEVHPVGKLAWEAFGKPDVSYLISELEIAGEEIGFVSLIAEGRNRYTQRDLDLLDLLQRPFAIAMANGMKHQELLNFKDILADDNQYLNHQLRRKAGDEIIGQDSGLRDVVEMVQQVAPLSSQVLLLGETGTGKEVIANAIHYSSTRASGPFIKVNCGAIPDSLIDSELFGHEKGSFTGAHEKKRGRFERADQGTIFLDEIGELPPQAQVRLLRVIQNREIERVGGTTSVPVDIRIIAATHRNLTKMVSDGRFREDLWFRLNVFPITIPPLRHRRTDIQELVSYFIERKSREMNLRMDLSPAPGSIAKLQDYHWPGNVRELENVVERALIRSVTSTKDNLLRFDETLQSRPYAGTSGLKQSEPEILNLEKVTIRHIETILRATNGKVQGEDGAAAMLGINASTLRNKMKKLSINYGHRFNDIKE